MKNIPSLKSRIEGILGSEFVQYDYKENLAEQSMSFHIKSSMSSALFEELILENVKFYYDGKTLVIF